MVVLNYRNHSCRTPSSCALEQSVTKNTILNIMNLMVYKTNFVSLTLMLNWGFTALQHTLGHFKLCHLSFPGQVYQH